MCSVPGLIGSWQWSLAPYGDAVEFGMSVSVMASYTWYSSEGAQKGTMSRGWTETELGPEVVIPNSSAYLQMLCRPLPPANVPLSSWKKEMLSQFISHRNAPWKFLCLIHQLVINRKKRKYPLIP